MTKRYPLHLLCTLCIPILLAACGPAVGPTPDETARQPFRLHITGEDGAEVTWESYTQGFLPGTTEIMHVAVQNNTDQHWDGRLCVQLLEPLPSSVVISLTEQDFSLEMGGGFARDVSVELPADLAAGTYGLALVVHQPTGPVVDVVSIRVGEGTREPFQGEWPTEAALEACPPSEGGQADSVSRLVELAKADLAQRLGASPDEIEVKHIEKTQFPDTSLGVPEPGKTYAHVTPGYIIELAVEGQVHVYHGGAGRVVAVPDQAGQPPTGRGKSTLPDGACVSAELWADGVPQAWWPMDVCAPVRQGAWELATPLPEGEALRPGVQYMLRAYQPGGPNIVATFPFDLDAPPTPPIQESADDPTQLLPDSAELLHQASGDLDGDGAAERIFLAGFGGLTDRLGYDALNLLVLTPSTSAEAVAGHELAWHSEALAGDRAESMEVRDINGDDRPEVLCLQAMGAAGETLQIVVWSKAGYGLLRPRGGYFDGQEAFGEKGVRLDDVDGDGLVEILASYGPAAESTDVYGWDGQAYTYRQTLSASPAGDACVGLI